MAEHPRPPVAISLPASEGQRRFSPRPWHHDWHHLRALRAGLEAEINALSASIPPESTIVDYGAGETPYRSLFEAGRDVRYLAYDLGADSEYPLNRDGTLPLETASADAVVSFQVLEHVPDPQLYLSECLRVLRPGGHLLLSTHGTWLYHPHPTDYWRWTRDGLLLELERGGFRVTAVSEVVGPLAWTTQFRLFGYREFLLRIPLAGKFLTGLLCLAMNLRMLLEEAVTPRSIRRDNACVYIVSACPA